MKVSRSGREPWFAIRRELSPGRRRILTAFSFLLPLGLWCAVSYLPFIWHPDIKLQIGASGTTVYTAGDHIDKGFFPEVAEGVREENQKLIEARQNGETPVGSSRENKKILRQLAEMAIQNGYLNDDQREDDAALYEIWKGLANGSVTFRSPPLTDENLAIVKANWADLAAVSQTYDSKNYLKAPLLRLVPQGKSANPVYLPAPHEVFKTGLDDWKREPGGNQTTLGEKLQQSLKTVLLGFLLASLVAVPIGIIAGTFDFFGKLFEPFIDFFRYMPAPAFGTLLIAVFGVHGAPKVALVFLGTFPHLLLMITKTTRMLDPGLLEAAQTLGASRKQLIGRVVIPGIWPNVYNDLRIALGWAWTWLVIAELIGVKMGLTEVIDTQGNRRNFDRVYPVIILIGMIGFFTDQVLSWLRRYLFPWTGEQSGKPGVADRSIRRLARGLGAAMKPFRKPAPNQSKM